MIRHVFSWRVAEGHSNDDVVELLKTLREPYPYIRYWELGSDTGSSARMRATRATTASPSAAC